MELDSEAFWSSRMGGVIPVHRNLSGVYAINTNHIKSPSEGRTGYSTFIAKKTSAEKVIKNNLLIRHHKQELRKNAEFVSFRRQLASKGRKMPSLRM